MLILAATRSEEHTSELQSLTNLVCRLLLEKKKHVIGNCWPFRGFTTMKAQVKLGRIAGISIGLNYSWFIIALLIALSLVQDYRTVAPGWRSMIVWIIAAVTALLFFVTLLLHELAHSLVAKTRGLRVSPITLFALGGVFFF